MGTQCLRNSRKLGNALRDGPNPEPKPADGWEAHHLVEGGRDNTFADGARDLLSANQIDIDSRVNGVWLPKTAAARAAPANVASHGSTFGNGYSEAVLEHLEGKISGKTDPSEVKQALLDGLAEIKLKLQTGTGPFAWP